MSGLNCGIPSAGAWDILKNSVDASMRVEDKYAEHAMKELYYPHSGDARIISGESGAGGLAGFIAIMTDQRFEKIKKFLNISARSGILFFNTEGATDPEIFDEIVKRKG